MKRLYNFRGKVQIFGYGLLAYDYVHSRTGQIINTR